MISTTWCVCWVYFFTIKKDFQPDPVRQWAGLALMMADRDHCGVFVTRDPQGAVVGMLTAQRVVSTVQGTHSVWIEDLVIEEAYRGQGLGKVLLIHAEHCARSHHATRVQLLVDTQNMPAVEFYDRLGWEKTQLQARRKHLG